MKELPKIIEFRKEDEESLESSGVALFWISYAMLVVSFLLWFLV